MFTTKLEKLLLSNWTNLFNYRDLLKVVTKDHEKCFKEKNIKIKSLKITRFEPIDCNFIIWIEYQTDKNQYVIEYTLSNTGILIFNDCG